MTIVEINNRIASGIKDDKPEEILALITMANAKVVAVTVQGINAKLVRYAFFRTVSGLEGKTDAELDALLIQFQQNAV